MNKHRWLRRIVAMVGLALAAITAAVALGAGPAAADFSGGGGSSGGGGASGSW